MTSRIPGMEEALSISDFDHYCLKFRHNDSFARSEILYVMNDVFPGILKNEPRQELQLQNFTLTPVQTDTVLYMMREYLKFDAEAEKAFWLPPHR